MRGIVGVCVVCPSVEWGGGGGEDVVGWRPASAPRRGLWQGTGGPDVIGKCIRRQQQQHTHMHTCHVHTPWAQCRKAQCTRKGQKTTKSMEQRKRKHRSTCKGTRWQRHTRVVRLYCPGEGDIHASEEIRKGERWLEQCRARGRAETRQGEQERESGTCAVSPRCTYALSPFLHLSRFLRRP